MESEDWLFLLFGLPTWALVDGTWASLSQLANHLPEGYNISAYLILSLTIGNIFPLGIGYIMEHYFSTVFLINLVYAILLIGCITGILISIFYDSSVMIGHSEVSLPLCLLFFIVGGCSSSSNVTHFTYVSTFPAKNTTALGTGMGTGSMIAGVLALLQGVWLIEYGFNTSIYYITLSSLYLPAIVSFYYLTKYSSHSSVDGLSSSFSSLLQQEETYFLDNGEEVKPINPILKNRQNSPDITRKRSISKDNTSIHFIWEYSHILFLQAMNSSLGYGFVPALISYACGKFPNANTILLWATGTAAVIDPWCKFATNYYRFSTYTQLLYSSLLLSCFALGLLICSILPSNSSFYSNGNGFLPVVLYISFNALFGFTNISIFRYFKELALLQPSLNLPLKNNHDDMMSKSVSPNDELAEEESQLTERQIQNAYRYNGIASQSGALIGSVIAFSLVITNSL